MKKRLNMLLATAAVATVLLTGCVSSKKYKSSQATLQQVRNDSARLAQQVASLNDNVHNLEQKNTSLQRSLDSTSSDYASQKTTLDYYQNYFNKQQGTLSQVSEELKGALTQAGLANEDVQQQNDAIYVSLDENKVFKKNSAAFTTNGKQAMNSLAQVIKGRSDINVAVGNGDSTAGQSSAVGTASTDNTTAASSDNNNMSSNSMSSNTTTPAHHRKWRSNHSTASRRSTSGTAAATGSASAGQSASASTSTGTPSQPEGKKNMAVAHKRSKRKYSGSEGSMTFSSNGSRFPRSRAWALNQGRMNTVANGLLQNGVPKVNLLLQQPPLNGNEQHNIKVIITPTMNDFNPQKNSSAKAGS